MLAISRGLGWLQPEPADGMFQRRRSAHRDPLGFDPLYEFIRFARPEQHRRRMIVITRTDAQSHQTPDHIQRAAAYVLLAPKIEVFAKGFSDEGYVEKIDVSRGAEF